MAGNRDERRAELQHRILAVSQDEVWLGFARKILRRTDQVETLVGLDDAKQFLNTGETADILLVSSELVPARIKEFQDFLDPLDDTKTWVLIESHDEHHRISDKHLKHLGVDIAQRPDNAKAMRRLLKIIFS